MEAAATGTEMGTSSGAGKGSGQDVLDRGFEAALKLAATRPWNSLSLRDIAEEAGLPLSSFQGVADRDGLALHADTYFDRAMSAETVDEDDLARERLFDVIMLRYEAMEPHREGLLSLYRALDRSAALRLQRLPARRASAEWAFISAGLDGSGQVPMGIKAIGLAWVLARAEDAWRRETDPGFAKTMSALDKGLRQAEQRMQRMGAFGLVRKRSKGSTASDQGGAHADVTASNAPDETPAAEAGAASA
ncbi:MAG: hypothetical protein AAGJ32_10525 [Pseudomonadota bacterium]